MDREGFAIMALEHPAPSHAGTLPLSTPIAEDFAAIHTRLLAIRDAERGWMVTPEPPRPTRPAVNPSGDFYGWLMGGALWAGG
jgi:hypothetical protein